MLDSGNTWVLKSGPDYLATVVGSWGCLWFKHGGLCRHWGECVFLLCWLRWLFHSIPCRETHPLPPHSHNSKAWHKLFVMQTTTKHSHALQQTVTQDPSSYCVQKWRPRATRQCSLIDLKIHSLPVMFISPLVSVMILSGHFAVYRLGGEFYPHTYIWYASRDLKRPTPT